jgi:hypothetical protein
MQVKSYDYIPMQKKFANQQKQDQQRRKNALKREVPNKVSSRDW